MSKEGFILNKNDNEHLSLSIHIPEDRISVVIGNKGKTKNEICKKCNANIEIESEDDEYEVEQILDHK